jgi:hypothetical protein
MEEFTRERVPLDWAKTQMNMGLALERLGERESGRAHLEQAVEAFRLALQENTRERVPLDWAETQFNLGLALVALEARSPSADTTREALTCFQQAEPILRDAGMTQAADAADRVIDRLQHELGSDVPPTEPPG